MPKPLLGITKKKKPPAKGKAARSSTAATTSTKRHKTGLKETPFMSLVSGLPYLYDDSTADETNFITCTPLQSGNYPTPAMPISAVAYITAAVKTFATKFIDLVEGPEYWVAIYQLDSNSTETFHNFINPGLVVIPGTKVTVHFASAWMESLIEETLADFPMSQESDYGESSSDNEPFDPIPPGRRNSKQPSMPPPSRAVVTEIPNREPAVASTSKSALQPAVASTSTSALQPSSGKCPSTSPPSPSKPAPVPDTPVPMITDTMPLALTVCPLSNQPATPETRGTDDQSMEEDTPAPTEKPPRRPDMPRRVRPVYRSIDFKKLEVEVPKTSFATVLFRPTEPGATLHKANPFTVNDALEALGAEVQRRRLIRDGGLALDFLPETNLDPIMTVTTLASVPVTAHLPATKTSAQGVVCGVHWEITEEQIKKEMKTEPETAILDVKRLAKPGQQSWTVKITFAADQTPTRAFLAGQSHRIRPYENRPLQCFRCGVFGHAARVCRSKEYCWTCSGDHAAAVCPNKAVPKCRNCHGPHPVDSPSCPSRLFQLKVAEVKAKEGVPFKTARTAVNKAVRTYASALKGASAPAPAPIPPPTTTTVPKPGFKPSTPHLRPPTEPPTSSRASSPALSLS